MATTDELQKQIDELKDEIEGLRGSLGNAENSRYGDYERRQAIRGAMAEQDAAELEHMRQMQAGGAQIDQQRQQELSQRQQIREEQHKSAAAQRESAAAAVDLGKALVPQVNLWGKSAVSADKLWKGMGSMVKVIKGGIPAVGKFMAAFTGGIIMQAIQLVLDFIAAIVKMTFAVYDAGNKFKRTTGATEKYAAGVKSTYMSLKGLGLTTEEAIKTHQDLYKTVTDFTMATGKERQALANTAAVLSKLGVSTDSYAKGVQGAIKGMGVSIGDADEMMLGMAETATQLGVDVGQFTSQFAAMSGTLAKFGKTGPKVFKELSRVSKITGMDMRSLLDMTNKFDTFESAAEQAGKLNAALGGNMVNAMDMMMETDPAERFKTIRNAILDTGLSFDDMSYYQKQFYTQSLGLKDVGELAAMMSGDMDALGGGVQKTEEDYAAARAKAASYQDAMEQLKNALIDMVPIMTKQLLPAFKSLMGWLKGDGKKIIEEKLVPAVTLLFDKFEAGVKWLQGPEGQAKIKQVMDTLGKAFDWLSDEKNQKWMKEMAIDIGKAVIAFKILGTVITPIITVLTFFGKILKGIGKAGKWLFGKGADGLSRASKGLQGVSKAGKGAGTFLKGLGPMLGPIAKKIPLIGSIIGGLMNAWDSLVDSFDMFASGDIVGGIGKGFAAIFKFADGFLSGIPGLFFEFILKPLGIVDKDFESFSLITMLLDKMGFVENLMDDWRALFENFAEMFNPRDMFAMLLEIPSFFWEVFKDLQGIVPTMIDGVLEAFGFDGFAVDLKDDFFAALESGVGGAFDAIKDFLGISSPASWVMENIGWPIVDAILAPFRDLGAMLLKMAQAAFNVLPEWAQTGISNLVGTAMSAPTQVREMGSAALDYAGSATPWRDEEDTTPSGPERPYEVTINLELDRKVLAREVITIMGNETKQGVLY